MKEINNIPKHWQEKSLGEIFTIERGGSPRPIEEYITNDENGINWIKIGDTKNVVKYISRTKEKIKPEGVKRSRMVYEDDFLLSNSMSFGRPYIMKTTGCIHDGWLVIRKNEIIDNNYLYYILSSSFLFQQFSNLAKGSTVKNLNIEAVKQAVIRFPPLPEQQAIVAKIEELLSELENGKQQLLTAQQQLKVYRQSLLKWAFEGKLTNKYVKEGELPEGWKSVNVNDIVEKSKHSLKAGPFGSSLKKEFYVQKGYKIYGQEQVIIDDAFFGDYYINEEKYLELKSCRVKPFDILISLVGTVGKVLILPENSQEGVINPRLIKITLNKEIYLHKFFKYYFESSYVKNFYSAKAQGTTMDVLNLGIIKTIPFPMPSLKEQQQIVEELESKLTVCDKIEETISQSLQQAETLRQSILKKAFEGKLITTENLATI
ncbi:restriction endonuclease subunit S [Mongoliitalea daihaiensis]|uniref:restriction endonuclease subunit S n=1 Tax=Mongoliitalea daihaiensis TaxID=2782006 RepID=UPI001F288C8B|nr:restriction endonuclease subunit S [Mongoliitalea daihaiensis]UJP64889.1 restriction endonuclease subunit S [Mongoliitalea daihaiensis]